MLEQLWRILGGREEVVLIRWNDNPEQCLGIGGMLDVVRGMC